MSATTATPTRHPGLGVFLGIVSLSAYGGVVGFLAGAIDMGPEITSRFPFASPVLAGIALLAVVALPTTVAAVAAWLVFGPDPGGSGTAMDISRAGVGALDPAASEDVEREAWPVVRDADELHDALLTLVWVPVEQAAVWTMWLPRLLEEGRAVEVSVDEPGVTVRARPGYYAICTARHEIHETTGRSGGVRRRLGCGAGPR